MKKTILLLTMLWVFIATKLSAQSEEAQQLLLNVEKLAEFKQILSDLKKGYQIISTGYSTIKDLSEGNFNLHKTFLDALMTVSPTVKKCKRIADIINNQMLIVKEYKNASGALNWMAISTLMRLIIWRKFIATFSDKVLMIWMN